mgnify:CR=1 FL=1
MFSTFVGGVNTSSNACFRLCKLKANLTLLLRRITNTILCHPEFISGSHKQEILKQVQNDIIFYFKSLGHSFAWDDIKIGHTFKKAFAFTLAETLIVMGIIGVVAALTIPNLNSSTANKEKVAKVMKVYSNLNDAFGRAQAVYGPVEEWVQLDNDSTSQITRIGERVSEFLKVSKTCGVTTNQSCFSSKTLISNLDGTNTASYNPDANASYYKSVLADGSSVGFVKINDEVLIVVNIEGSTKVATWGKNTFGFALDNSNGVIPRPSEFSTTCFSKGVACTPWVIKYGNMDYLKVDSSGKCPNGKTILDGTTNTSCK